MRNISFALTTEQIRKITKDVTRRNGWLFLKVGDKLQAVEKCQGLKKGEKVKKLCQIEVLRVDREPLNQITQSDCIREGFPEMGPIDFVMMYCKANKCEPDTIVTRIEFKYL